MLDRVLEPELMDTAEDAREYDAMDHAAVNGAFVTDLFVAMGESANAAATVLDLGTGTALIPIELCRRAPALRVVAMDAAKHMLKLAQKNVDASCLGDRIKLLHADAKRLPFDAASFQAVISNSILHHLADPFNVLVQALAVTVQGGLQFHRDLCRPASESEVDRLVGLYAGDATPYQQKLLADSLRAALTLEEMRVLARKCWTADETVQLTSDRHWTWSARRPDFSLESRRD